MKRFLTPLLAVLALPTIAKEQFTYFECSQQYSYEGVYDSKKFNSIYDPENQFKIDQNRISSRWKKIRISDAEVYSFTVNNDYKAGYLAKGSEILTANTGFLGTNAYLLANTEYPKFSFLVNRESGQFVFSDDEQDNYFSGFCTKVIPPNNLLF